MYSDRMIWTGLNVTVNMRCLAMLAEGKVDGRVHHDGNKKGAIIWGEIWCEKQEFVFYGTERLGTKITCLLHHQGKSGKE